MAGRVVARWCWSRVCQVAAANVLIVGSWTCGSRRGGASCAPLAQWCRWAVGRVVAAAEVRARCTGATSMLVEGGSCAGGMGGWQLPRRSQLHRRQLPRWFWWAAWRALLGGRWLPRRCGMQRRHCHGGGREQVGGLPGRLGAAVAEQAARAKAASVVFAGGSEGGGCGGDAR